MGFGGGSMIVWEGGVCCGGCSGFRFGIGEGGGGGSPGYLLGLCGLEVWLGWGGGARFGEGHRKGFSLTARIEVGLQAYWGRTRVQITRFNRGVQGKRNFGDKRKQGQDSSAMKEKL